MNTPFFHPVIFDPPPAQTSQSLDPQNESDTIIPRFCLDAAELALPTQDLVATHPVHTPLFIQTPPVQNVPSATATPGDLLSGQVKSVPKQAKAKAYDVAQELVQTLPMLVVGEALYFFDGHVYCLATANEMRREIIKHCRYRVQADGTTQLVKQVYEFIRDEPGLVRNDLQEEQRFVALENGLLDLQTGAFGPFDPRLFVTARIKGRYLPELISQCPAFNAFLDYVSCGDPLLVQRIWEVIGYCLVPDTAGKVFFLAQGVPNSGKSVLGGFLSECFDEEAVTALNFNDLGQQFGPSELLGKRLSLCMDLSAEPWNSRAIGLLKSLTGNDLVSADVKYCPRIKFRCTAKFLFGSNHPVTLTERDDAFMRRLVVIPFRKSVPSERQDRMLKERLNAERDAIITTALAAYFTLRAQNYSFTGNYHLNEVIAQERGTAVHSWNQAIPEFFFQQCELDEDSITFADDLFQRFVSTYPELDDLPTFSTKLFSLLEREFPRRVKKVRKRRPGVINPLSAFKGVRLVLPQETPQIKGGTHHV